MLQKEKVDPIVTFEEPHIDVLATDNNMKTIPEHDIMNPSNTHKTISNNATSTIRLTTRPKNLQIYGTEFFMVGYPNTHTRTAPVKTYTKHQNNTPLKVIH